MQVLRPSAERGLADFGWLNARYSFSFAQYYDPAHMGASALRVLNEDRIAPGGGFPPHGHADMEIITYVLEGALEHMDSMGNTAVIRAGEVQLMSAGSGVTHSEHNTSPTEPAHLLQIWVKPARKGGEPRYQQRNVAVLDEPLALLAAPEGERGALVVQQDMRLYRVRLDAGASLARSLAPERVYYLQVAKGAAMLNDRSLAAGDGVCLSQESFLGLTSPQGFEALLFDLP